MSAHSKVQAVSIADKFALFSQPWQPKRIGTIDGYDVRLARLQGEFVWHSHADADEFFLVIEGVLRMHFREKTDPKAEPKAEQWHEDVPAGSLIIVPKGMEHKPEALTPETKIMLVEKSETVNTGDGPANARTVADPEYI
jgi:mannose-6-phosphate isomerase-like protein (cupin superfamily)